MSYTPTNWKSGDVVTSAKLNKLEEGVASASGGGVTVVPVVYGGAGEASEIQMPASELLTACLSGVVFIGSSEGNYAKYDFVDSAGKAGNNYSFYAGEQEFSATSGDDYPATAGSTPK